MTQEEKIQINNSLISTEYINRKEFEKESKKQLQHRIEQMSNEFENARHDKDVNLKHALKLKEKIKWHEELLFRYLTIQK